MSEKAIAKTSKRPMRLRRGKRGRTMTMFTMKNDAAGVLSGYKLPAGTKLAVVSTRPDSVQEVKRALEGRYAKINEVVAKETEPVSRSATTVVDKSAFEPDARSRALLEGVRIAQEDLREAGGAYDLDQVRTLMRGVTRQAVDKRVQEGSLIAVPGPSNRRAYPTVQFNRDGTVVPGLKAIRDALHTTNPWTVLNFLVNPDFRLEDRRPIELLKSGELELVVQAAARHGEQGA